MRLTLIYPAVGRKEHRPYVRAWQMQPLSMALLASLTPSDIDVRFYDDRVEDIPFDEPTDLVALSVEDERLTHILGAHRPSIRRPSDAHVGSWSQWP